MIGDALVPRKAMHAIAEGRAVARSIGGDRVVNAEALPMDRRLVLD